MSSVEGKLLTCDVCGETTFLKHLGTHERDGGYTEWREYEKADGWNAARVSMTGDLCPSCSRRISEAIRQAIDEIQEGPVRDDG